MGKDVLSHSEVESLLGSIDPPRLASRPLVAPESNSSVNEQVPSRPQAKVSLYDFKRPERIGKEPMSTLQSMHEGFGRNFGASLSALLRSTVEVKLTSVEQLTYREFVSSLENPSCFNLLKVEPLQGYLILDINPSVLYPIIDRLLGGGNDSGPPTRRPLTEIELRLVRRITDLFMRDFKQAWSNVIELDLTIDRVESNPQLVQIVPPDEVVVLISFELNLRNIRGMVSLCIPFNSIEHISNKLTTKTWFNRGKKDSSEQSQQKISQQLTGAVVQLVVELVDTKISTADLLELRIGDIITTEMDCQGMLSVTVEGVPKFHVRPGAVKGQKAFQIESTIPTLEKEDKTVPGIENQSGQTVAAGSQ